MKNILTVPLWIDIDPRSYTKPTVVRFRIPASQFPWEEPARVRYAVCGTDYGWLHTTSGDIPAWNSYSGAYKAMKRYMEAA